MSTPTPGLPPYLPDRTDPRERHYFDLLLRRRLVDENAFPWATIDKTGSSLADFTTRDHDLLTGLLDDDHPQYYKADGTRALAGPLQHTGSTVGFYSTTPAAQSAAIASLTDNTGGTANSTMEAIPDPADTPATADDLRDDLVANALPAIRNDLADLAAKVNAVLVALRTIGVIAT